MRSLVLLVALFAAPLPAPSSSTGSAEVKELVTRHADAVERGDVDALDRMYSHDAGLLIFENGGQDEGWETYREHHLKPELAEMKGLRFRCQDIRASVLGELAWATFDFELAAEIKSKPVAVVGKGTMVFRRDATGWKIVHEHTSGRKKK